MRQIVQWMMVGVLALAGFVGLAGADASPPSLAEAAPSTPDAATTVPSGRPTSTSTVRQATAQQITAQVTRAMPPALYGATAVWDPTDLQFIVYGGKDQTGYPYRVVWGYRPQNDTWTMLEIGNSVPVPRTRHSAVWDAADNQMLVFGGTDGASNVTINDLWAYRPADGIWVQLNIGVNAPPSRLGAAAVWDPQNNQMLVYGGLDEHNTHFSDLWAYRLASHTWTQLSPTGAGPGPLAVAAATWDATNNQMLMFGGENGQDLVNALWSYHPASNTWTQLTPAGDVPGPIAGHTTVWDSTNHQMLVFGGSGLAGFTSTLWAYRPGANTWTQIVPTGGPPIARAGQVAAWDSSDNEMLVYGGASSGGFDSDLWGYRTAANTWVSYVGANDAPPPGRNGHTAVWDTADKQMVIFGGSGNGASYNDLWTYKPGSNTWTPASPSGTPPTARGYGAAAWDTQNTQMLELGGQISGGETNDLWRYKATNNTWLQLSPSFGPPAVRAGHTAVWDPDDNELLVYGGLSANSVLGDLWTYRPSVGTWSLLTPVGITPGNLNGQSAVWDPVDHEMLMFAGDLNNGLSNDIWAYHPSNNSWTRFNPSGVRPAARGYLAAVWDTLDNEMLVFGGGGAAGDLNDLWAFKPATSTWTQLIIQGGGPSVRNGHTAVWDPDGGEMLIFGGKSGSIRDLADLWSIRPSAAPAATATPTATATSTATPTNTATPTPTLVPARVGLQSSVAGPNRLQVTVTARATGCAPNGQLSAVHFTRTENATVDIGGRLAASGDLTVPVSPAAPQITFYVHRVTAGQAATVSLVVTDGCGAWTTFVGGGPNAF